MSKKLKKFKVGIDSETYAISMVDEPAIEEEFVALAKEEEKVEIQLSEDEKHMVYGAVLVPDKDIYRNNGEQEFYISFSKESIEKMAQDFMKEYRQKEVTLDHSEEASEVCVVESWIKADLFKDKSVALGLNEQLPVGTWFAGMKVNNIETWERIKAGELRGFSVESLISLEEFGKQNENNMDINETNEMNFWTKMKEVLSEVFTSTSMSKEEEKETNTIEPIAMEDLEAETPPATETVVETPTEPVAEEPVVEPEPTPEPVEEPTPEPVVDNHLEELVNSLKQEIETLKEMNNGLQDKVKELGKQPSAAPVNPQAKPSAADTYSAWREKMRQML